MKNQIFLYLILISFSFEKIILKCRKKDLKKAKKKCIVTYNLGEDTYKYIKPCKKGKICQIKNYNYGYCIKKANPIVPNSKCNINEECPSNICENNKCSYKNIGEKCYLHTECKYDSYCDPINLICKAKNENCFIDEQCKIFEICDFNDKNSYSKGNGKCIQIGSKENSNFSINKFACKSGFINKNNQCDTISTVEKCVLGDDGLYYSNIISTLIPNGENYYCKYDENNINSNGDLMIYHNKYNTYFNNYLVMIERKKNKVKNNSINGYPNVGLRRFHGEQKKIRNAFFYVIHPAFIDEDDCFVNYFRGQILNSKFRKVNFYVFLIFILVII